MEDAPDFDVQGHRGARGHRPENTMPSFRFALETGVPTLEMDVVISGDDKVVVSHEPWFAASICTQPSGEAIRRRDEKQHNLYELSYAEIARYDCGKKHPDFSQQEPEPVAKPLLSDVIKQSDRYAAELEREVPFYSIETKSRPSWEGRFQPNPRRFAALLMEVLDRCDVLKRSIIQSFDPHTLQAAREISKVPRHALLISPLTTRGIGRNLKTLGYTPEIYSPDRRMIAPRLIRRAHERGMHVIPWTVNERTTMKRFIELGVDGYITDYPDVGIEVWQESKM